MGTYPTAPRAAFLDWCQGHEEVFTDNAAAIGLTPAQALAFKNATDKAADRMKELTLARQATAAALAEVNDAFSELRGKAGDTVRTIRAFAESSTNPATVYNTAQIPAPASPSPVPPPAQPTDLRVELDPASGEITLRWKCSNPPGANGTSYIVRRKLPGDADFSFIGVSGSKKFIDTSLIAGPDMVQYTVQGQRSELSGPLSPVFTINFGRTPGGSLTVSVSGQSQVGPSQNFNAMNESNGSFNANGSTVNGQPVQKVLPGAGRVQNSK